MNMTDFQNNMADILEVDAVDLTQELATFACWDSLTVLSIIAYASESFGVELTNTDIINSLTVGGLEKLIMSKM
jgi:acyl carrier protein